MHTITHIVSAATVRHTLLLRSSINNTELDLPEKAKTTKTAYKIYRDAQYRDTILVIRQYSRLFYLSISVDTGYILADSGNACSFPLI